jgi:DeoR family transcriptional regulator, myo-inositol catabolism operon repressor
LVNKEKLIESYIFEKKQVTIQELMVTFELSDSTIRRYLSKLESQNLIKKEYGYVSANTKDSLVSIRARINYMSDSKKYICSLASNFINSGDTIFVDSGSTHLFLTDYFGRKSLNIITNNLLFAIKTIDDNPNNEVTVIQGKLNNKTISLAGEDAIQTLENYYFDYAFLTASGVSLENGCSNRTAPEAQIKKKIIQRSHKTILLVDSTKFEKTFPFSFASLSDFDYVLTDVKPSEAYLALVADEPCQIIWK